MLANVKKIEESLLMLRRSRKADDQSTAVSATVSDEDKIRRQLFLDVAALGELVCFLCASFVLSTWSRLATAARRLGCRPSLSYSSLYQRVDLPPLHPSSVPVCVLCAE